MSLSPRQKASKDRVRSRKQDDDALPPYMP